MPQVVKSEIRDPREWMLVEAYSDAEKGDYSKVKDLYNLFRYPYDEQKKYEGKYYRKAPTETYLGVGKGGKPA